MVIRGGNSVFLIITPVHAHRHVQQLRRHIRRKPSRNSTIRRNIRPRTLQTAASLTNSQTPSFGVCNSPSLRETPPTNQTPKTVKSRIIAFHILLSAERKTTVMPPHPAGTILPVIRHIRYLPLIVSHTTRRMFSKVHQDSLRMRRNRLTVHGNHTANVDAFPNLPLQSSANARLIEDADPRPQCLVLLQCVPVVVEPDEKMQMGGSRKLGIRESSNSAGGRDVS